MTAINIESARHNMVVSQIRTGSVLDDRILELVGRGPRQDFVPDALRNLAFVDMQIPLGHGEVMMAPLVEARLLQELAIKPADKILEIGTGSGYMTWLLAQLGGKVHSVEIRAEFIDRASGRLAAHGARNVELEIGDGARGWDRHAPYDVILVTGSLPLLPEAFKKQLAAGGRLIAIVGQSPAMQAQRITRITESGFDTRGLFETDLPPLQNALAPSAFAF
ncbi:MAG TPA: protein-L-isoaspartate O-methyltransferase [Acidiferrobacterales bacterium]|nr:protein-L-isoaspartate O-methyltransferase [Acidiferrobacterales bacterium]